MKRLYRELNDEIKQKISDGMKRYHQNTTTAQRQSRAENISVKLKDYWSGIKSKTEYHTTMNNYLGN